MNVYYMVKIFPFTKENAKHLKNYLSAFEGQKVVEIESMEKIGEKESNVERNN